MLSLIPAKNYFDEPKDEDLWKKRKKLKKERREQKRNPDGNLSAKEVMDMRAKTAKPVVLPGEKAGKDKESGSELDNFVFADNGDFAESSNESETEETVEPVEAKRKKELSAEELAERQRKREELKEKLASKISMMREKRKAPGTATGPPAKLREQILQERKERQATRKEALKRKREEDVEDERQPDEAESDEDMFYGTIKFDDGLRATTDMSGTRRGAAEKSGPGHRNYAAHLEKLDADKRRMAELPEEKRQEYEEKNKWKSLIASAEGGRPKDDEKLLKKAIKRKEKRKLKSEHEWSERIQLEKSTQAARIQKRDENLRLRKENKGKKWKHQTKLRKYSPKQGKKRAGFEGSAKSKPKRDK